MNVFHEFERDDRFMSPMPAAPPGRPIVPVLAVVLAGLIGVAILGAICNRASQTQPIFDLAWNLMAP